MRRFVIACEDGDGSAADVFIRRGLLSGREGRRNVLRYARTPYVLLTVALPAAGWVLLTAAVFFLFGPFPLINLGLVITPFLGWSIFQAARRARAGRVVCLGCFRGHTRPGPAAGGMRLLVNEKRRRLLIAGLYVDPAERRQGVLTALFLGLFRWLERRPELAGCRIRLLAPIHPASVKMEGRYCGRSEDDRRNIRVDLERRVDARRQAGIEYSYSE